MDREGHSGTDPRRERFWGVLGGIIGAVAGVGAFLVALAQGEKIGEMSGAPYPPLFARKEIMALDYYFLGLVVVGAVFLVVSLVAARVSPSPRTDTYGPNLDRADPHSPRRSDPVPASVGRARLGEPGLGALYECGASARPASGKYG